MQPRYSRMELDGRHEKCRLQPKSCHCQGILTPKTPDDGTLLYKEGDEVFHNIPGRDHLLVFLGCWLGSMTLVSSVKTPKKLQNFSRTLMGLDIQGVQI
jgi:hypothetical protein